MTASPAIADTDLPTLRTASGQPPLGADGRAFRDDQGEIFVPDNPRYRSAQSRLGVLALDNGKWLAKPPVFHLTARQYDSRDQALRAAIAAMIRKARALTKAKEGEGLHWNEGYANRVIEWALSLKPSKGVLNQGAAAGDAPLSGHPGGAASTGARVTDEGRREPGGAVIQQPFDPVIAELVAFHKARKAFPSGHTFSMTNPIINGNIMSVATCSCGVVFSYPPSMTDLLDAMIEVHWQGFDHLPEKIDGRGQQIKTSDGGASAPGEAHVRFPAARVDTVLSTAGREIAAGVAPGPSDPTEPAPIGAGDGDDDWLLKAAAALAWKDEDDAVCRKPATYQGFLKRKVRDVEPVGFDVEPNTLNPALKPFQRDIVRWALRRGRAALFAGTGLGKTLQQLSWADQVAGRAGPVLVLTPLAVAQQTVSEAEKFSIGSVAYARSGAEIASRIVVTNYERLDKFDPSEFAGVVLDESSILKAFDGKTRQQLIDTFARTTFKLCCTATPAPNDYTELGNHAEFLGVLQHKEMLATWFVHDGSIRATNVENYGQRQGSDWRLKGHAHDDFWRWLASWSVMIRHPRDLGYHEPGYDLPPLRRHQVLIETASHPNSLLGPELARKLSERLAARRNTIDARVKAAAEIVNSSPDRQWLVWCNLNDESSALATAIPGAVEVRGSDDPDVKASRLLAFARGEERILISKPSIAGWGMNFQRCADMVFVGLNDSFEQLYQAVRRCWRFGQDREVNVHLIAADVEGEVVANLEAKEAQADYMAEAMAGYTRALTVNNLRSQRTISVHDKPMKLPQWLMSA